MDVLTLRSHIINGGYSNEDLELLGQGMRIARERLVNKVKSGLSVGDSVRFSHPRVGGDVTGVVEKIAVKFVTVRTPQGGWRVPANLLTAV